MNRKEAYSILGVSEASSEEDIKKAYRKKAMEHHPDRHQGSKEAEEQFKKIALAYETLTKEPTTQGSSFSDFEEFFSQSTAGAFSGSDFFKHFFNKSFGASNRANSKLERPGQGAIKLSDAQISNWSMTLKSALLREEITLNLTVKACCEDCLGNDKIWKECTQCKGTGQFTERVNTNIGVVTRSFKCSSCKSRGWKRTVLCNKCHGDLVYDKPKIVSFSLPENYKLGQQIRLKGKGNESWKAPHADIYIMPSIHLNDLSNLSEQDRQKLKELFEKE